MTAFDWLIGKTPWPVSNFSELEKAFAFLKMEFEKVGVSLPERALLEEVLRLPNDTSS